SIEADRSRADRDGVKLEGALNRCGVQIERFPEAQKEQKNAAAYLELHIEQGPVLERMGLPLGAVLGTKGVERHIITFHGQEAHSGSTPMNARRDALAAAAKLALEIRTIAKKHDDAVCTVGSVKTFPGIATAVVGRCEVTLDQRDLDGNVLAQMYHKAQDASNRFAAEENCTVNWSRLWNIEPVPFHSQLLDLCQQAVLDPSDTSHRMTSRPHADAAEDSRAVLPTAMVVVQHVIGISHTNLEDTPESQLQP